MVDRRGHCPLADVPLDLGYALLFRDVAERFDSAIYLWPSFSVISSAAETFAERLGQALCFGPLTGRTGRTSPLAGVSSPLVLAVFSVLLYV